MKGEEREDDQYPFDYIRSWFMATMNRTKIGLSENMINDAFDSADRSYQKKIKENNELREKILKYKKDQGK